MTNTLIQIMALQNSFDARISEEKQNARKIFDAMPAIVVPRKGGPTLNHERKAMKFFRSAGISKEEIAVKFGVSFYTVRKYV